MTQLDYANAQMALLVVWSDTPTARQIISKDPPIGYIGGLFEKWVTIQKLINSEDYDLAEKNLNDLPQSALVQIWLAGTYYHQGKRDLCIASLEKLRETIPNDALLLSDLSYFKGEMGDLEAAIEIGDTILKGTTEDDYCSQTYLFNTHYNMACWKYRHQVQKDEPNFSGVYTHLQESKDLEQRMLNNPFKSVLVETIRRDIKKGYFNKIKREPKFLQILQRAA